MRYNSQHGIVPKTIIKRVREKIIEKQEDYIVYDAPGSDTGRDYVSQIKPDSLTPYDRKRVVKRLEKEMKKQAEDLNFELAIMMRDKVKELKSS